MKYTAIWIIDENYVLPAYLSICSLLSNSKVRVKVVYCSDLNVEQTASHFESIDANVEFETFSLSGQLAIYNDDPTVRNRLARMHYARKATDEVVLLVDADILFTKESPQLFTELDHRLEENTTAICGVLDAKIAYRDHLYFRSQNEIGREIPVPHLTQKDIYQSVFGKNWWHHLKGASLNNGLLAFYNCSEVIESWESFYLKGLEYKEVNSGDDQLPLAGAIFRTKQNVLKLDEKFNSKGAIDGNFVVYHALSSAWKMQTYGAIEGLNMSSGFSKRIKEILSRVPDRIISNFTNQFTQIEPYLYRNLDGKFGFKHLYADIIMGLNHGKVVEVNLKHGKSACYMAELIQNSEKDITFYTVDTSSKQERLKSFWSLLEQNDLHPYVNYIHSQEEQKIDCLTDIDFVFLNLENDYDSLTRELEFWYKRSKPGGILAGYDYTSQIGLNYGDKCATYDFCNNRNLSLRISFDIFIIELPKKHKENLNGIHSHHLIHQTTEGL